MSMADTLELAKQLIGIESVSPNDNGCQKLIEERLSSCGFEFNTLQFNDVTNLWATRGETKPMFVFAGHTDVVPPGPLEQWTTPPFTPVERDGFLYGRGAVDMKSSIAAMITAVEAFVTEHPKHRGSIGFLITSDEEAKGVDGTKKVVQHLLQQGTAIDYCLVGEPSSDQQFGDTIKAGRRGSLNAVLIIHGKQGHIAYPHLADNPIHKSFAALKVLCETEWDQGNALFQPTSFQISNIQAGEGVNNVIPGSIEVTFNFRFSPEVSADELQQRLEKILTEHDLNYSIEWSLSGDPFMTEPGELSSAVSQAVQEITDIKPQLTTGGGTSDGRFIAKMGCQVMEFGPINASMHKIDERINIENLNQLHQVYLRTLELLLL